MRPDVRSAATAVALVLLCLGLAGCGQIPQSASKKDFCTAGERFSALDKATFADGRKAIDRLAAVGTPPDIDTSARSGFVELVSRMKDSDNAEDFRRRTRTMNRAERKHLLDLDDYIRKTCVQAVG
ncbi:MAG: hypothetical protein ACJ72D_23015 [Marmoricola sp.]